MAGESHAPGDEAMYDFFTTDAFAHVVTGRPENGSLQFVKRLPEEAGKEITRRSTPAFPFGLLTLC